MHSLCAARKSAPLSHSGVRESPRYQQLVDELDGEARVLLHTRTLHVRVTELVSALQSLAFLLLLADMVVTYLAAECVGHTRSCRQQGDARLG
jgi:hypothetical protein